jgi:hypothetical protein
MQEPGPPGEWQWHSDRFAQRTALLQGAGSSWESGPSALQRHCANR